METYLADIDFDALVTDLRTSGRVHLEFCPGNGSRLPMYLVAHRDSGNEGFLDGTGKATHRSLEGLDGCWYGLMIALDGIGCACVSLETPHLTDADWIGSHLTGRGSERIPSSDELAIAYLLAGIRAAEYGISVQDVVGFEAYFGRPDVRRLWMDIDPLPKPIEELLERSESA